MEPIRKLQSGPVAPTPHPYKLHLKPQPKGSQIRSPLCLGQCILKATAEKNRTKTPLSFCLCTYYTANKVFFGTCLHLFLGMGISHTNQSSLPPPPHYVTHFDLETQHHMKAEPPAEIKKNPTKFPIFFANWSNTGHSFPCVKKKPFVFILQFWIILLILCFCFYLQMNPHPPTPPPRVGIMWSLKTLLTNFYPTFYGLNMCFYNTRPSTTR